MFFIKRRIRFRRVKCDDPQVIEPLRAAAKSYLPARLQALAQKYGFSYNRVCIKHNISNWGSCSSKSNINLNLNLMRVPEELRDFVMLHELCHLRYLNHGAEFHRLLESLCLQELGKGSRELAAMLKNYKLI